MRTRWFNFFFLPCKQLGCNAGLNFKIRVCKLVHLLCLLDCSPPPGGRKSNWQGQSCKVSWMKQQHFLRAPAIDILLILLFCSRVFLYTTWHTHTTKKKKNPTQASYDYLHEHPHLGNFFVTCIYLWAGFRRVPVVNFHIFCVYPIVNWSEMKQTLRQPKQPLCSVKFPIKITIPSLESIKRRLIKWNTQATALSHDAGENNQLQMATNAQYDPERSLHGTEFGAERPKNGPY